MDFYRFNTHSMKARLGWVQESLDLPVTNCRDKSTVRAITNFQKENGLTPTGNIDQRTFELLNSKNNNKINIRRA